MYNFIALIFLTVLTVGYAQLPTTSDPYHSCGICDRYVAYAEYFYLRNPNATKEQVQAELIHECDRQQNADNQQNCIQFVDSHINTIYNEIKAGKRPFQICGDLGLCPPNNQASTRRFRHA